MALLRFFPVGFTYSVLPSGSIVVRYGSDGTVYLNPDGLLHGPESTIRKLITVFKSKSVKFIRLGKSSLVFDPVSCA